MFYLENEWIIETLLPLNPCKRASFSQHDILFTPQQIVTVHLQDIGAIKQLTKKTLSHTASTVAGGLKTLFIARPAVSTKEIKYYITTKVKLRDGVEGKKL